MAAVLSVYWDIAKLYLAVSWVVSTDTCPLGVGQRSAGGLTLGARASW